jgi:cysteine desulfurase
MTDSKIIYLDNAATTKPYDSVIEKFCSCQKNFYNPAALYKQASDNAQIIKTAKKTILGALHAPEGELYFTSGGTESDNWAIFATKKAKNSRIIVGEGEHDAVVNPAKELAMQGYDVCFAPINPDGSVNVDEFTRLVTPEVSFVSIMHVSNETGAVNDISRLVKNVKAKAPKAIFHSDGVQAFGKTKVNLRALGVDLYSISAHKIHGLKGIGALFVKKGTSIKPLLFGGGQESGMRSGTENLPMICAFEEAVKQNQLNFDATYSKKVEILEHLRCQIAQKLPNTTFISSTENSVPNILTVAFEIIRGEVLLHSLEKHGILVGIGSACSSHHESRFKKLLNLDDIHRDGIVRFSLGDFNTVVEIDFVVEKIVQEIETLKQFYRK